MAKEQPQPSQKKGCCNRKPKDPNAPPKPKMINYFKLFKYSPCTDKMIVFVGFLMAIISGACLPSIGLVMARITDAFDPMKSNEYMTERIIGTLWIILIMSIILWIGGYF